jgi:hypothetical protein
MFHLPGASSSAAISRDGRLAIATGDGGIGLIELDSTKILAVIEAYAGMADKVLFSVGGQRLLALGDKGTLKVFDAASQEELLSLPAYVTGQSGAALAADGCRLVTWDFPGEIKLWDAALLAAEPPAEASWQFFAARGYARASRNQWRGARDDYTKALELEALELDTRQVKQIVAKKADPAILAWRAIALCELSSSSRAEPDGIEAARRDCEAASKSSHNEDWRAGYYHVLLAQAYRSLADALQRLGKIEEAKQALEKMEEHTVDEHAEQTIELTGEFGGTKPDFTEIFLSVAERALTSGDPKTAGWAASKAAERCGLAAWIDADAREKLVRASKLFGMAQRQQQGAASPSRPEKSP